MGPFGVVMEYGGEYFEDEVKTVLGGVNSDGKSSIAGAFSQTTLNYGIFDLTGGLRYDYFTLEGRGTVPGGTTPPLPPPIPMGPFEIDQSKGRLNPKLTLAAHATPWLQLFGTYSEAMRAPTTIETIAGGSHPGASTPASSLFPNPALKHEVQQGIELGSNVRVDGLFTRGDALRMKAAYFDMDITNYILTCTFAVDDPPGTPVERSGTFFCNAPGKSRVKGVELEGMYDAGNVFAGFSYTYAHSTLPAGIISFGAHTYLPDHYGTVTLGAHRSAADGGCSRVCGLRG